MKTIFDAKELLRDGYQRVIKKQVSLVHDDDEFHDGLGLFLFVSNYSNDIPSDWFTTDDYIDLQLHFDIDLIVEPLIDSNEFVPSNLHKKNVTYIDIKAKKKFDILQKQLIKALHKISKLEFVSAEDHYQRKFKD
jgi:hypothetical protein